MYCNYNSIHVHVHVHVLGHIHVLMMVSDGHLSQAVSYSITATNSNHKFVSIKCMYITANSVSAKVVHYTQVPLYWYSNSITYISA